MKKIVCNICQGSSFRMINSDEYECQGCGIVYTADQMRSLLKDASGQKTEESIRDEEKEDSAAASSDDQEVLAVEKTASKRKTAAKSKTAGKVKTAGKAKTAGKSKAEADAEVKTDVEAGQASEEKAVSEEKTVSEEITVSVGKKTSVAEKEETPAENEKKRAEQIEFYTKIAKRVKKQCPKCGSKNIEVNGVFVNRKKGLGYYLTGQAAYEMGMKHGSLIAGALGYHEPNAKCHDCGCEWNA